MCGIAGLYRLDGKLVDVRLLKKMRDRLSHRGPDGKEIFFSNQIGLSHTRLKIIDLTDLANQPMTDESRGTTVVYNGEIYNYLELREELEVKGFRFRTSSDTEVLLAAYSEWGIDCLQRFNGMFAFSLWDRRKQWLFNARDRFGIKPFYYYYDGKQLCFASEIKSLLLIPEINIQPNWKVIFDYLMYAIVEHTHDTFFKGIKKLPPASYMIANVKGILIGKYWDLTINESLEQNYEKTRSTKQVRELLKDSIRLRLRSDVPIGSCLSGGIDSTSIVCLINSLLHPEDKKHVGNFQKTFSAVFEVPSLDERPYIQEVISLTKAEANWVNPTAWGFLNELDSLLWHQEEPFTSTSIYAQWCVFRTIQESGIKVVLDGQGADEQLCGYRKFYYFFLRELAKRGLVGKLTYEIPYSLLNIHFFKGVDLKNGFRYFKRAPNWVFLKSIIRPRFLSNHDTKNPISYGSSLGTRIKLDMTRFSLPSLLRYEDKNSMAFSIESRTPFLDFRFVEYLAALPLEAKIHIGWTKYILREAMRGIIPERIRRRRDKIAFDTPQKSWLKNELKPFIESAFLEEGLLSVCIVQKKLVKAYEEYVAGRSMLSGSFFFRAFLLERWAKQFLSLKI